jgi:uncharacterized Zn-binding protein involved in type VI secretion
MGAPAATQGHQVVAIDTHIVLVPSASGVTPVPLPHPYLGTLDGGLVATVRIGGKPVAVVGSTATNRPSHFPAPPGVGFQRAPSNRATVKVGSATVRFGGKAAARAGDTAMTCNDPVDMPAGVVVAAGTVFVS